MNHDENGYRVTLKSGDEIAADIVLSAVGLRPNIELAKTANLEIDKGVKVDRYMQTSDKNIYALGDCVQIENLTLQTGLLFKYCFFKLIIIDFN